MPIYQAIYDGPPRNYTATRTTKRYIAIHNTSNDASAEDEASYAKRRTDSVSSHYYVDSNSIVQSLDTHYRAWHAGSREGNDRAISYEITGVNGWTRAQWLDRVAWNLLAGQIRRDCAAHNITPRDLTVAQIKAGSLTGVITHNEMRLAWGGTTHTDPGPNFPMDHLIALVGVEEDDMDLTDKVDLTNPDGGRWSFGDAIGKDAITVKAALGYAAASDFRARNQLLPEIKKAQQQNAAILAAVGGLDTAAILARIDQRSAEDAARDDALTELVDGALSGERDAAEVLALIAQILTQAAEQQPAAAEGGA